MTSGSFQEAKQQFSRLVERARTEGPQLVTRNGKEVAVVLDVDEYRRLTSHGGDFKRIPHRAVPTSTTSRSSARELAPIVEL